MFIALKIVRNIFLIKFILLQSKNFFLALQNYEWTDKSPEIQQNISIMMSVAIHPLKISVGGIYSMSMVSYNLVSIYNTYNNIHS